MRNNLMVPWLLATAALGQQTEQTVGTSASANYIVPADEAAFTVEIGTPQLVGADQVVRVFADLGVKEENVVRVSTAASSFLSFSAIVPPSIGFPPAFTQSLTITWAIQFSVPIARFKEASDRLDAISRRLPEPFTTINYSGGLSYSRKALEDGSVAAVRRLVAQTRQSAEPLRRLGGIAADNLVSMTEFTRSPGDFASVARAGFPLLPVSTIFSARYGQAPDRFLSTTCAHDVVLAADEALFRILVEAAAATPRSRLMETVARYGISERDLVDVTWNLPQFSAGPVGPGGFMGIPMLSPNLTYLFEIRHPVSRLREVSDRLVELRRAAPAPVLSAVYGAGLNVTERSIDQGYAKATSDAVTACRSRAERIAREAGVKLGAARSVTPIAITPPPLGFAGNIIPTGRILPGTLTIAALPVESNLRIPFSISMTFGLE